MSESANPPVGATVDALALRIGSAAADWNLYLNSTRGYDPVAPVQNVTDALETAVTALRALVAERDQLKARLDAIDAACIEVCRDNHESTVGDDVDTEMGRYVCIGESGAPAIDEDEPAEVVRRLSQVWERMQERLEKAEARVAELEEDAARLDWMETRPREHPAAGWVARESTTGRGYRLHTSVSREHETHDTVRAAIDAARAAQGGA